MLTFNSNLLLLTDSYKLSQWKQYPPNTTEIYSYFESRGGEYDKTVFFGLQYFLKHYLQGQVVTQEKIDQAEAFTNAHVGPGIFNREGWEYILNVHNGHLPIEIMAVPEGLPVGQRNVLMTVRNTDPNCFWLTSYLETLLVQVWYPTTVASRSRHIKSIILDALYETGDPSGVNFKLHDFGFRGVSSVESAGIGDAAHLVNFSGCDTIAGILLAQEYYNTDEMLAFNIPASEHSTMTSWGRANEADAYRNMLEQFPTGLLSVVSDSYDIFNACENIWGGELRDQVLERDGTLVVRPDSGHPVKVVGKVLQILAEKFGEDYNDKGFRVLNDKVRVIQGDGIDDAMIGKILEEMKELGFSADNIVFGSGGGLLQKMNRDTNKFAFKCSNAVINGEDVPVYKQPVTSSMKASKKGRLWLYRTNGSHFTTYDHEVPGRENVLKQVFLNGEVTREYTFEEVRANASLEATLDTVTA